MNSLILVGSIVLFLLLAIGMVIFGFKYRRRPEVAQAAIDSGANLTSEFLWSFIPFLVLLAVVSWGWKFFVGSHSHPQGAITIEVVGKMWEWNAKYTDGLTSKNEILVPVGKPVVLRLSSEDILHNFYVPSLRINQEVAPGKAVDTLVLVTEPGEYRLFCGQDCGKEHSNMLGMIKAVEFSAFEAQHKSQ